MPREQAAVRRFGATGVTLSAGRVTRRAVIVERFLGGWRIHIRTHSLQVIQVAVLSGVQTGRGLCDDVAVTSAADLVGFLGRVLNHPLMRRFFFCHATRAAVTGDTTEFAVDGFHELGVADEHFFPHFQWG